MKFKFVCLNIWSGGKLFDNVLPFLDDERPDILALQEVHRTERAGLAREFRTLEVLNERYHYPATEFAPAFVVVYPHVRAESGNAVMSKFPIVRQEITFFNKQYNERVYDDAAKFPTTPRNLQHVVLDTPAGEVNVFNFQGVWDLDGDNFSPARREMSEIILEKIDGLPNVILTGDTNAKYSNPAIKMIEEKLVNVFAGELTTSFNMRRKTNPGYATAAVDMLFVSPNIKVLEHECPDVDVSDHFPLTAILEI